MSQWPSFTGNERNSIRSWLISASTSKRDQCEIGGLARANANGGMFCFHTMLSINYWFISFLTFVGICNQNLNSLNLSCFVESC